MRNAELQMMFEQQQKLLKLLQDKPETLEHIKTFVGQLKENGACSFCGCISSCVVELIVGRGTAAIRVYTWVLRCCRAQVWM